MEELLGEVVVVDLSSTFVCLGKLMRQDELYLELGDADLHDMRDSQTSREFYIADSHVTGIKRNRKRVLVFRSDVVAISRLQDVVEN